MLSPRELQYVKEMKRVGSCFGREDLAARKGIAVTISKAAYGRSSSAIIELIGSPPTCTVFIDFYFREYSNICVYGRLLKYGSKKWLIACSAILSFLREEYGIDDDNQGEV